MNLSDQSIRLIRDIKQKCYLLYIFLFLWLEQCFSPKKIIIYLEKIIDILITQFLKIFKNGLEFYSKLIC